MNGQRDWTAVALIVVGILGAVADKLVVSVPAPWDTILGAGSAACVGVGAYLKTPHPALNPPK